MTKRTFLQVEQEPKVNSVNLKTGYQTEIFQCAAKRNGVLGGGFGCRGGRFGEKGKSGGVKGGRPNKTNFAFGFSILEYKEILEYWQSDEKERKFPESYRGGSSKTKNKQNSRKRNGRKSFKKKCSKFRVQNGNLVRRVIKQGAEFYPQVAVTCQVSQELFLKFYRRGQTRAAWETFRTTWFFENSKTWFFNLVKKIESTSSLSFVRATPGADIIISKAALTFRPCFDDIIEGRVGNNGLVCNGANKRPSQPKTFGQLTFFTGVEIFKWNGIGDRKVAFHDTTQTLWSAFLLVKNKNTAERSSWETTFNTFCDVANFPSKTDCGHSLFSSFKGKVILQGTMSNHRATEILSSRFFGFSKVLECKNFFTFVLQNSESFDAIVDNPPWDFWFLKLYFRFLRFLGKPCVIILPTGATQWECFLNVFGRDISRTTISKGTDGEKRLQCLRAKKSHHKKLASKQSH